MRFVAVIVSFSSKRARRREQAASEAQLFALESENPPHNVTINLPGAAKNAPNSKLAELDGQAVHHITISAALSEAYRCGMERSGMEHPLLPNYLLVEND